MSDVRVTPWQDGSFPAPSPELLAGMKARRPGGELIGIDRVLLKSFPLATGWNGLGRGRADFDLPLTWSRASSWRRPSDTPVRGRP
ncbi:hypothetical protein [Streptomyces capillispiralis]|uniref:Uncharacterized protein n=1 Tax=Streptomyces capillispiralis TaxID=68182 RepID=A0A561T8R2_9ACTN|nr:hypothetical protein [Streptomyces capillispiralis]TWF83505.1 hypothetical protein FHX78_11430 [Streptomyces capillispiralis]GHH91707.1 hypothetical protein GCM10017779_21640 [Streptomyces capillispiralis]